MGRVSQRDAESIRQGTMNQIWFNVGPGLSLSPNMSYVSWARIVVQITIYRRLRSKWPSACSGSTVNQHRPNISKELGRWGGGGQGGGGSSNGNGIYFLQIYICSFIKTLSIIITVIWSSPAVARR